MLQRGVTARLVAAHPTLDGPACYAIGSNPEAARRAGINTNLHLIKVYALAGLLSGLGGVLSLAYFTTTTISGHTTDNLTAIAAVVIGGLAGVFATNVLVAQGVDTGLKTAHAANKIKIIGYDADPTQVADLKSGVVQALIAQEPYQEGVDGVEQAVNALTGKPTQSILTGLAVLTRSNLSSMGQYVYKSSC